MRALLSIPLSVTLLSLFAIPANGQNTNRLLGTWERIYVTNDSGVAMTNPTQPFLVVSADGFYAQVGFPPNRPKLTKPLAEYTKEELLARFRGGIGRFGKYTLSGARLTRTNVLNMDPAGTDAPASVQDIRWMGDTLSLLTVGNKGESRWIRAK